MKSTPFATLLGALVLSASVAHAQAPAPEAATPAPRAAAQKAGRAVNLEFRGTLRDAVKRIAAQSGLNVVATGALDTQVEVHLTGVTGQAALRTIARAYDLRLDQDGGIFTLRPMTPDELRAAGAARPATEAVDEAAHQAEAAHAAPPPPGVPPVAPVPPVPPMPEDLGHAVRNQVMEEIRRAQVEHNAEAAEQARERADEQLRKLRDRRGRNVVARGQPLVVRADEVVDSAVVYGNNLTVKGHVEDDAVAFGGNLEVEGHVEGDAIAFGGNVVLKNGASVGGDAASFGGSVVREDGSHVEGSSESFGGAGIGGVVADAIQKDAMRRHHRGTRVPTEHDDPGGVILGFLMAFSAFFGLGFLANLFAPDRMKLLEREMFREPVKAGLLGLLGFLIILPVVSLMLTVTCVGVLAVPFVWLAAMVIAALGVTIVASRIGKAVPVLRGRKTQAMVLAMGLVPLLLTFVLPPIGILLMLTIGFTAVGAAIRYKLAQRRNRGFPEPIMPTPPEPAPGA